MPNLRTNQINLRPYKLHPEVELIGRPSKPISLGPRPITLGARVSISVFHPFLFLQPALSLPLLVTALPLLRAFGKVVACGSCTESIIH